MKCPYCISEIHDEAIVCATCRRDLYLFKPLLERIESLEAKLASMPPELHEASLTHPATDLPPPDAARSPAAALTWCLLPLLLLVLGHWVMTFLYDVKVLYLRIFALLLPLPFGFLFARAARIPMAWSLLSGFVMAALSVLGMSSVTAMIDQVPTLPQNTVEIREFIEFAMSIGLSFTTGLWLWYWAERHRQHKIEAARRLSANRHPGAVDSHKLAESLTRLNDIGSGIVAFATTAFSIYTGLKGLLN